MTYRESLMVSIGGCDEETKFKKQLNEASLWGPTFFFFPIIYCIFEINYYVFIYTYWHVCIDL